MSAETASSLFPDRPIRPLPKRRLRERLSPEAAESIQYPQPPQSSNSLFSYPYSLRSDDSDSPLLAREGAPDAGSTSPMNLTTEEEEVAALRRDLVNRMPPDLSGPGSRPSLKTDHGRQTNAPPHPLSAVSSVDGYDQLENANNKKKRKIPTAGDATLNGVHALAESGLAPLTISGSSQSIDASDERASPSTPYQGSGNLGAGSQNLAGPGRGRYGRPRSGRSPLRPLCDSTNNWAGRNGKARPYQWSNSTSENTGIISTAIANAEKLPPQQGQENISLLQQPMSIKRSPASNQFTFTCGSQVPGVAWPHSDRGSGAETQPTPAGHPAADGWSRGASSSQTAQAPPATPQAGDAAKDTSSKGSVAAQGSPSAGQKQSRRSLARECNATAKARRRETQLYNKRHPPKPDEIWICHFCEYESIFGHPPEALVRQYEIKDRKQRQLEQQRRAQWERMKKGKHKGKKNNKLPAKTNAAHDPHHAAGTHGAPMHSNYSQGTQSEEYYDDEEYDDEEYDPEDDVPLETQFGPSARREGIPTPAGSGVAADDKGGT